jgi:alcohol dehydrogenase class IV
MIGAFSFDTTRSIRFEPGGAARLAESAGGRLGRRILVVTDRGLIGLGLAAPVIEALSATGSRPIRAGRQ